MYYVFAVFSAMEIESSYLGIHIIEEVYIVDWSANSGSGKNNKVPMREVRECVT